MSKGDQDRDLAASMSLLTRLLNNPLDAGYHAYAKHVVGKPLPWWRKIVILLIAVLLGFGTTEAVRHLRAPVVDNVIPTLQRQVEEKQSGVEKLSNSVRHLTSQIQSLGEQAPQRSFGASSADELLDSSTSVSGPGITVTLDQERPTAADQHGAPVLDQDVRMVLNALWAGGAEAISVNGLRVGPATYVRTAGASILINLSAVSAPYVIEAIGDANMLQVALAQGSSGDYLSAAQSLRGIQMNVRDSPKLDMDGLDPVNAQYAQPQNN